MSDDAGSWRDGLRYRSLRRVEGIHLLFFPPLLSSRLVSLRLSFPQRRAVVQLSRCKIVFSDSPSSSESNTRRLLLAPIADSKTIMHCDSYMNDHRYLQKRHCYTYNYLRMRDNNVFSFLWLSTHSTSLIIYVIALSLHHYCF